MSTTTMPAQKQDHQPGVETKMRPQPDYEPRYPGVGKLKDKVALITGGDSGIGRAVAVAMAREGAKIAIIYLEEHKDANKTSELVKREGSDAILISGDVGEEKFCKSAVDKALEKFGHIDILVNNAAEQHETEDVREIDAAQIQRTFRTNVFSFFYMVKHALAHMNKGACIINTTSVTRLPRPQHAARLLRHEGRNRQLHAIAVRCPGQRRNTRQRGGAGPDPR